MEYFFTMSTTSSTLRIKKSGISIAKWENGQARIFTKKLLFYCSRVYDILLY